MSVNVEDSFQFYTIQELQELSTQLLQKNEFLESENQVFQSFLIRQNIKVDDIGMEEDEKKNAS